jgi:hypothetical protein
VLRHALEATQRMQAELARLRTHGLSYPSTWLLEANGTPRRGLIDVPPRHSSGEANQEFDEVCQQLVSKLPAARVLQVRRCQNEGLYRRFHHERGETARSRGGDPNERRLWMSSGVTQPDVLCNSAHGFDPTYYLRGGSYGIAAYFAEEPLYSHYFRACEAPPPLGGHQLILARVALGEMKDFGALYGEEDVNSSGASIQDLQREPRKDDGTPFDSWSGTEGNLDFVDVRQARCPSHRGGVPVRCALCTSVLRQCQQLKSDGARYGRQYMVARFQKAYPEYIIRYVLG